MKFKKIKAMICLATLCAFLVGCNTETNESSSSKAKALQAELDSFSQPNLSLHKPKTLSSAIERLKQINESLTSKEEFPEPTTIKYVEVIHGKGASGHSHYYTAESYAANGGEDDHDDHADDHEHEETVKHRSVEVDFRTELKDIVRWLPDIAAKSNLNETQWNSVDSISERLTKIIEGIPEDASDESFRESWKLKSDEIEPMFNELQTLIKSAPGVAK